MKFRPRLEGLEQKFHTIEKELSEPEVLKDQTRYQKLTKELFELRTVMALFETYKKAEKEAGEMAHALEEKGLEAEMRKLYNEELKHLKSRQESLVREIENELLKGSDPDYSRDLIMEIRAGT